MGILEAIVLGLVEGLTEYLPISSTGHLILAQRALGIGASAAANAYVICIQAGAIVAVLGLYRRHVAAMARGLVGRDAVGRRLLVALAIAFAPAAAVGLLFGPALERLLFGLLPVIVAWFVGGVAILLVARRPAAPDEGAALEAITPLQALAVGLLQCLAFWPGTSRSLVTILGGRLAGLRLVAAVEFSFLLGAVTLLAATAWAAWRQGEALGEAYGPAELVAGFVAAAVAAALAVRWLVRWLEHHGLAVFGHYRIALAVVVLALAFSLGWPL